MLILAQHISENGGVTRPASRGLQDLPETQVKLLMSKDILTEALRTRLGCP